MVRELMKDEKFLSQKAQNATQEDIQVARDLKDTLCAHANECVGMAANMIGVNKNIIVFSETDEINSIMINPVIISKEGEYHTEEGCLCLKGKRKCTRYSKIQVEYFDNKFVKHTGTYRDFVAEIIQHEIDHTNGILI